MHSEYSNITFCYLYILYEINNDHVQKRRRGTKKVIRAKKSHLRMRKNQWKKILSLLIYFYSLEPWIRLIDLLHFRLIHIFKNSPLEAKNVRIILKQEWTYFTFLIFLIILYKKKIYQKQWKELIQKKESRYISLDLLRIRTWVKRKRREIDCDRIKRVNI